MRSRTQIPATTPPSPSPAAEQPAGFAIERTREGFALPRAGGSPLSEPLLSSMETSFGRNFTKVRAHQSERVAQLGAVAAANGDHIHFAPGQYQPSTFAGRRVIGHELTHVVQQHKGLSQGAGGRTGPLEREAVRLGERSASGLPCPVEGAARGPQFMTDEEQSNLVFDLINQGFPLKEARALVKDRSGKSRDEALSEILIFEPPFSQKPGPNKGKASHQLIGDDQDAQDKVTKKIKSGQMPKQIVSSQEADSEDQNKKGKAHKKAQSNLKKKMERYKSDGPDGEGEEQEENGKQNEGPILDFAAAEQDLDEEEAKSITGKDSGILVSGHVFGNAPQKSLNGLQIELLNLLIENDEAYTREGESICFIYSAPKEAKKENEIEEERKDDDDNVKVELEFKAKYDKKTPINPTNILQARGPLQSKDLALWLLMRQAVESREPSPRSGRARASVSEGPRRPPDKEADYKKVAKFLTVDHVETDKDKKPAIEVHDHKITNKIVHEGPWQKGSRNPSQNSLMKGSAKHYVLDYFFPGKSHEGKSELQKKDSTGRWEWLHIIGASLGGNNLVGNLVAGSYDANTQMIPLEHRVARWGTTDYQKRAKEKAQGKVESPDKKPKKMTKPSDDEKDLVLIDQEQPLTIVGQVKLAKSFYQGQKAGFVAEGISLEVYHGKDKLAAGTYDTLDSKMLTKDRYDEEVKRVDNDIIRGKEAKKEEQKKI